MRILAAGVSRHSLCVALALMLIPGVARAANLAWANNPGALSFTNAANWVEGVVPGPDDIFSIDGVDGVTNYAFIDSPVTVQRFVTANLMGEMGGFEIRNGGNLTTTSTSTHYVGARGIGHARILNGGTMNLAGSLQVGWGSGGGHGTGFLTQEAGSTFSASSVTLGTVAPVAGDPNLPGSVGTYTVNGGTASITGPLIPGLAGTGNLVVTGGTVDVGTYLQVGRTGTGSVVQSGGTLNVNRVSTDAGMVIAAFEGATGTYEISGGTLNVAATNTGVVNGAVGSEGTFKVIGSGPTVTIGSNFTQIAGSTLAFDIGPSVSAINVGGDLNLDGALDINFTSAPSFNQPMTLVSYAGALNGTFATFDNVVDGPGGADTVKVVLDYGTGANSSIVVRAVQEFGDFNFSGGIDTVDFFLLSDNLGAHLDRNVGYGDGDIDSDGDVDLDDFHFFKQSYPAVVAAAIAQVPEPFTGSMALLMGLGGVCAAVRQRRHRRA